MLRFDKPSAYSLTDEKHGLLGSVKILSMNSKFVRVELDLINEAMMTSYKNGISNVIELERHNTAIKGFIP